MAMGNLFCAISLLVTIHHAPTRHPEFIVVKMHKNLFEYCVFHCFFGRIVMRPYENWQYKGFVGTYNHMSARKLPNILNFKTDSK